MTKKTPSAIYPMAVSHARVVVRVWSTPHLEVIAAVYYNNIAAALIAAI